jgi:hypothetical protein
VFDPDAKFIATISQDLAVNTRNFFAARSSCLLSQTQPGQPPQSLLDVAQYFGVSPTQTNFSTLAAPAIEGLSLSNIPGFNTR